MKTYNCYVSNDSCIFDSAKNFTTALDAIKWGMTHGDCVIQVEVAGSEELTPNFAYRNGQLMVYTPIDWQEVTAENAASMI